MRGFQGLRLLNDLLDPENDVPTPYGGLAIQIEWSNTPPQPDRVLELGRARIVPVHLSYNEGSPGMNQLFGACVLSDWLSESYVAAAEAAS